MSNVRVRFAPSPTGNLHVGSARTALFNYLFAKALGGTNILRIEDTDFDRSAEVFVENIIEGLNWLGIVYDEGPIRQSQRLNIYKEYAEKIVAGGHVYKCYCTEEELTEQRKIAQSLGKPPRYDGRCKKLSAQQVKDFEAAGRQPAIRFEVADKIVQFNDLIRGEVRFDCALIGDFVIIKSNGTPSYNFAAVVDDALMQITHVMRGEDHISNTPKQILLYEALGFRPPQFAHLSMILGPDRTKLSKRHGAKSVTEFRDEGFLKEALLNFLMLLSWSPRHNREILSLNEAVKLFKLEELSKSPSIFDIEKLKWMNGMYIRELPAEELAGRALPFLKRTGLPTDELGSEQITEIVGAVKDNLAVLGEVAQYTDVFFKKQPLYTEVTAILRKPEAQVVLPAFQKEISGLSALTYPVIESMLADLAKKLSLGKGVVLKSIRAALTGKTAGPELWRIIKIFGRDRCVACINYALKETR